MDRTFYALLDGAGALFDDMVRLRRRFHRHPEVGLQLPATQETILEGLTGLCLEVRTWERLTSVVAILHGASQGPTVLLRADMDALPISEDTGLEFASQVDGVMHACGHDAHVAMLIGAARLLTGHRDRLAGRVLFMFQPGEEGYDGARLMIEEGLLERDGVPAAAFAIHCSPTDPAGVIFTRAGPLMAASDGLQIVVQGRGGHGAIPHECLDPIPIACEIVQALQTYVTRRVIVFNPAVITIARITAGTTGNVIPEMATLIGTMRTVSERTRAQLCDGVRRLAEGIAMAHGAEAEVAFGQGPPVLINDGNVVEVVSEVVRRLFGPDRLRLLPSPDMASEDFSYLLQRIPGAMVFLGMRPQGDGPAAPVHSNRMILNESAMATGIALHAAMALRFLDPGRLYFRKP
jgi:hippurate hydrolase